jgi:hypothetical protein
MESKLLAPVPSSNTSLMVAKGQTTRTRDITGRYSFRGNIFGGSDVIRNNYIQALGHLLVMV